MEIWLSVITCGVIVVGAVVIVTLATLLLMRKRSHATHPGELTALREEVAQLREEIDRLKKKPSGGGSTDFKEL